jgi:ketosteroid isomerase-like protein
MKFIMSLVALAALSFVTSAFAQEESPAPSPEEKPTATPEEKASATVEEKPAAKASSEESKTTKKEGTTAEKKETTSTEKKGATAAASPAATSGKKMSTEAAIKDMENRWEASFASHDLSVPQGMVAADFVGVSPKFKFVNKSGMLAEFKSNKDTYKSAKNEALRVTSFGPNVAVVTGRSREKGTGKDGKSFDRTYYFTDTWMQRSGQWQCIGSQAAEARK